MAVRLISYSYRFAEQIFNSRLSLKAEMESVVYSACSDLSLLTRPDFNKILDCVANRCVLYYANVKKGKDKDGKCIRAT